MVFDYYHRLSKKDKAIYDRSDGIHRTRIPDASACSETLIEIRDALSAGQQRNTERATRALTHLICEQLETSTPDVKVLSRRPSEDWGELHGLYEPIDDDVPKGRITVWMRTAQRKQVVAPRSYLRTVIHELCHHLDYEHYELADSFHTEGFYKRESSIFRQLAKFADIPSATGKQNVATEENVSDAEQMRRKRVQKDGPFPQSLKDKLKP